MPSSLCAICLGSCPRPSAGLDLSGDLEPLKPPRSGRSMAFYFPGVREIRIDVGSLTSYFLRKLS